MRTQIATISNSGATDMGSTALDIDTFQGWREACFYPKADLPLPDAVMRGENAEAISDETIASACSEILRERVEVAPLAETGTFHRLWRVRRANGETLICRANAMPHWFRDFPLWVDVYVGEQLRPHGIPLVAVQAIDIRRQFCSTDLMLLDEAKGTALRAFDDDDEQLRPLLRELGAVLARLHRVQTEDCAGLLDIRALLESRGLLLGSQVNWDEYVRVKLDGHVEACIVNDAITVAEGARIRDFFGASPSLCACDHPVLLHGDPGNHNVFAAGGKITALIDWEDALAGDPVYEIAFWATFHPERRHDAFLDGYRSEAALPADFEARFWLYYVRVALAKTVLRNRLGLKDRPGREPAALRIRKGLHRLEEVMG